MATLTKDLAKVAAQTIRRLESKNRELTSEKAELVEKVATLEKERECRKLAAQMAAEGKIERSYDVVSSVAEELVDKDLNVVKQAMTFATDGFKIGSPVGEGSGDSELDPITKLLVGDS